MRLYEEYETVVETVSLVTYIQEARESGDVNLGDGRQLCSDCSSIAVMNEEEYNFIIENVFQFYRSLNLKVDENIPILFIDKNQMRTLTSST